MSQIGSTTLWEDIEHLIDQLCSFEKPTLRMPVYDKIYHYLAESKPKRLDDVPDRVRPFTTNRAVGGAAIAGGDVYHHVKFSLEDKMASMIESTRDMADTDVLRLYVMYWNQYKSIFKVLNGSCQYLNRHWVVSEQNSGRRDVLDIEPMSWRVWEESFFYPLIPQIVDRCCNIIKMIRDEQQIDDSLLEMILKIMNSRNFNEAMSKFGDNNTDSLNVYEQYLEPPLARDLEDFYQRHAISPNQTDSLLSYLGKVNQLVDKEIERTQSYLPESTKLLSIKIAEDVLIRDHHHAISNEIKASLHDNKDQELSILYKAIRHMPSSKSILMELIQNHIQSVGADAINSNHTVALKEPKIYLDTVQTVYSKWLKLIKDTLDNDLELIDTLNKACHYFVNNNSFIKPTELLAQYCDQLLRHSGKKLDDNEFEERCNQIMFVFDFIEDKDIFEKIYGKMLAKRLINQLSGYNDRENSFVSRLKHICGEGYTSKLERMIQDVSVSETITEEYQTYCRNGQERISMDFSIVILSRNSWPLSHPAAMTLPPELSITFEKFLRFYNQRHNGRKLTHLYRYSKGELQTYFTPKRFTFEVSLHQMVVLLLFNRSLTWTVEQISQETEMKMELIVQIMNTLIKSNLLSCSSLNGEDLTENDLHIHYPIELAIDYKNEKLRTNLNQPIKLSKGKESTSFEQTINKDRKNVIQAAIVRIMKGKKVLKYSLLMDQAIGKVSKRFKPDVRMIKICIDILIEKEYLRRQENSKDILEYIP